MTTGFIYYLFPFDKVMKQMIDGKYDVLRRRSYLRVRVGNTIKSRY